MPCRDWTVEDEWRLKERDAKDKEMLMLRASLCALLTKMEANMPKKTFGQWLDAVDWEEAGVTKRELMTWWEDHKEQDRVRRERMAEQLREIKLRKEALAKLTPEEKKVLGIK